MIDASQLPCKCMTAVTHIHRSCHEYTSQLSCMNYVPSVLRHMRFISAALNYTNTPLIEVLSLRHRRYNFAIRNNYAIPPYLKRHSPHFKNYPAHPDTHKAAEENYI